MNRLLIVLLTGLAMAQAQACDDVPIAGATTYGIGPVEVQAIALGLSARNQIINHVVLNDQGDTIGKVEDLIVAPDMSVTYAIVGVGGFLGVKRHYVAIPVDQFTRKYDGFMLAGATRELIKSLPAFDYAD